MSPHLPADLRIKLLAPATDGGGQRPHMYENVSQLLFSGTVKDAITRYSQSMT
jgi:hypothetical protein